MSYAARFEVGKSIGLMMKRHSPPKAGNSVLFNKYHIAPLVLILKSHFHSTNATSTNHKA